MFVTFKVCGQMRARDGQGTRGRRDTDSLAFLQPGAAGHGLISLPGPGPASSSFSSLWPLLPPPALPSPGEPEPPVPERGTQGDTYVAPKPLGRLMSLKQGGQGGARTLGWSIESWKGWWTEKRRDRGPEREQSWAEPGALHAFLAFSR